MGGVGDIEVDVARPVADPRSHLPAQVVPHVAEQDPRAEAGEEPGRLGALAPCRTGDDGGLSLKSEHKPSSGSSGGFSQLYDG